MGNATEIGRLRALDLDTMSGAVPDGSCSLVVHNPLAAPIFLLFAGGVPSASNNDVSVPGVALMAYPLPPGVEVITAVIDYAGGVPAGDAGQHATVLVTGSNQGTSVGPLA